MKTLKKLIKILVMIAVIIIFAIEGNQVSASTVEKSNEQDSMLITQIAANDNKITLKNIINSGKDFTNQNNDAKSPTDYAEEFISIGQILVAVGIGVVLVSFSVLGIKWITASPDKKAQLKQQLVGLVVAAIVIFGAIGIWNIFRNIGQTVEDKISSNNSQETVCIAKTK